MTQRLFPAPSSSSAHRPPPSGGAWFHSRGGSPKPPLSGSVTIPPPKCKASVEPTRKSQGVTTSSPVLDSKATPAKARPLSPLRPAGIKAPSYDTGDSPLGRARKESVSLVYDCMTRDLEEVPVIVECGLTLIRQALIASGLSENPAHQSIRLASRLVCSTALDHAQDLTPKRLSAILRKTLPEGGDARLISPKEARADLARVLSALIESGADSQQMVEVTRMYKAWIDRYIGARFRESYRCCFRQAVDGAFTDAVLAARPEMANLAGKLRANFTAPERKS